MGLRIGMLAYTDYLSDPRVRREAEALAERGDQVTIWCLGEAEAPAREQVQGVEIRRIRMPRYRGASAVQYVRGYGRFFAVAGARLALAHAKGRFDLIHVHTMPDFLAFSALLPRLSGAKLILDMHDLMPDLYALKFGLDKKGMAVRALRAAQNAAVGFSDVAICVHEPQYRLLLRDGVPAYKLHIVMNAPDPKLFQPRKKEPKSDEIRVIYHGTVLHRFGVDLAVEAFARAQRVVPALRLSILGDGDYLGAVIERAERLGIRDLVEFSGRRLPLVDVAQRVREAHIGLVANRDEQEDSCLPTKLLEYVAIGIPVVATRTRAIQSYFEPGQVEFADVEDVEGLAQGLIGLAQDPARRRQVAQSARGFEDRYGFEVQKRFLYRAVDAACADKARALKRQGQAAVEGKKTGRRPKPTSPATA